MDHNRSQLRPRPCRGNTLILVVGILVLLVIIATSYITRTHAGRITGLAVQRAERRDDNARLIADMLAQEIAEALFVRPLNFNALDPLNSNEPRLAAMPFDADGNGVIDLDEVPQRYGVDPIDLRDNLTGMLVPGGDGLPDYPFNIAPYHVVAFTNYPDAMGSSLWPDGPGNPNGGSTSLDAEGNPIGNPGFADTRWLRDVEPLRWDTQADGILDAFSHWRHLANIARPNNGWRICRDIGDVTDVGGTGGLVVDLSIPVEQWLPVMPSLFLFNAFSGNAILDFDPDSSGVPFYDLWVGWLGGNYANAYVDPSLIPPNFYRLSDLDGNGTLHDWFSSGEIPQDRPESEFIRGTARHSISRILADTDGDGYTDSFWFLAPTPIEGGIRQIVALSIIDNSALLNANVATRFVRANPSSAALPRTATIGATPSDVALVADNNTDPFADPSDTWNVGFFDNHANWEGNPPPPDGDGASFFPGFVGDTDAFDSPYGNSVVRYFSTRWDGDGERDFLSEIGVDPADLVIAADRLSYWQLSGSRPFSATAGLTPFTLADELELRMYHGQNYPWILSRFERAVNTISSQNAFLHSTNDQVTGQVRRESSEYLDQLTNRELVFDSRRKLTLFNGARNDLMPPWLWWRWELPTIIGSVAAAPNFLAQARTKLDLREPDDISLLDGERSFAERLAPSLLLALTDGDDNGGFAYFGEYTSFTDDKLEDVRRLAAAYAANILAWRDQDARAPLVDDPATPRIEIGPTPLPEMSTLVPENRDRRFLGMERQPFLLEAFIGHVYETYEIPPGLPPGWTNSGDRIILEDDDGGTSLQSTVVVVQIANPYDQPIVLHDPSNPDLPRYEIELFGQAPISLQAIAEALGPAFYQLPPAREDLPSTMILYSIDPTLGIEANFAGKWQDFLDIQSVDHPNGTILVDLKNDPLLLAAGVGAWDTTRGTYDNNGVEDAIRLVRRYDPQGADPTPVVIDRIDAPGSPDFLKQVQRLDEPASNKPPTYADLNVPPVPPPLPNFHPTGGWHPPDQSRTHWVQWVRISRAWGNDVNGDAFSNPSERNPRYVYAWTKQTTALADNANLDPRPNYGDRIFGGGSALGISFSVANDPDREPADAGMPWMTLDHTPAWGAADGSDDLPRKPTFFALNHSSDAAFPGWSYPDKGYYPVELNFPMQMLQKDDDFEQVGELLNVWLFGHELDYSLDLYVETRQTFSEFMFEETGASVSHANAQIAARANRLRIAPTNLTIDGNSVNVSLVIGVGDEMNVSDPLHAYPALPAGLRVLDAFVCDGPGVNLGFSTSAGKDLLNAAGFSGRATTGSINVNTAPPEVLRTLPHMSRLVHEINSPSNNPFVRLPESIVQYRERFGGSSAGIPGAPDYSSRDDLATDLRPDRGIASIGELMLLTRPGSSSGLLQPTESWRADFAAEDPYGDGDSTRISTDVQGVFTSTLMPDDPDEVARDVEEANLLFAGISNLITTRSDMFTVYFKIRSFRQNPTTGFWDATDPEYIVDDTRYVMLVDRSTVNRPTDKPKILYLERLPK